MTIPTTAITAFMVPMPDAAAGGTVLYDAGLTAGTDAALAEAMLSDPAAMGEAERIQAEMLMGRLNIAWDIKEDARRLSQSPEAFLEVVRAAQERARKGYGRRQEIFAEQTLTLPAGEGAPSRTEIRRLFAAPGGRNGGNGKSPLVGRRLGNYLILEELGSGGMATVYEAFHEGLKRKYAIKVIAPEFAGDQEFRERFMREAEMTREVVHPHVVGFWGVDWEPSTQSLYLVTEYLQGKMLDEMLRKGPMPWERARGILLQILEGLEAIHKARILHRDLKPGNIMLMEKDGEEDYVKILDLGIAKSFAPRPRERNLTRGGLTMGTPEYMSPEQAQAQALDHRTDIYSLGTIMYEMLTGSVPFEADTPNQVIIKHARDEPERPSLKNPQAAVSREAEAVILRALKKDPAERFQSAQEMAKAIQKIRVMPAPALVVEPVVSGDTMRIKVPYVWKQAAVASALLAMGLGWLGGFWMGRRREPASEKPEEEQPALVEKAPAPVAAPVVQETPPPDAGKPSVSAVISKSGLPKASAREEPVPVKPAGAKRAPAKPPPAKAAPAKPAAAKPPAIKAAPVQSTPAQPAAAKPTPAKSDAAVTGGKESKIKRVPEPPPKPAEKSPPKEEIKTPGIFK